MADDIKFMDLNSIRIAKPYRASYTACKRLMATAFALVANAI